MSRAFFQKVQKDEGLKKQVAKAIYGVVKDKMPRNKEQLRELVAATQANPELRLQLATAIGGVATANGASFTPDEAYDGELSDEELELIAGGPTAVEYAVMLSLIIVVCLAAIMTLGTQTTGSWGSVSGSW